MVSSFPELEERLRSLRDQKRIGRITSPVCLSCRRQGRVCLWRNEVVRLFDEERMDGGLMEAKAGLRASLIARLDELSAGIRSEQDLDRLKKMLDCAEGLLRVLRSM